MPDAMFLRLNIFLMTIISIFQASRDGSAFLEKGICQQACGNCQHEKNQKQQRSLAWEHRQHHESLIACRGNHHCQQGAETQHPVRIKRNGSKASHATRNRPEQSRQKNLQETILFQSIENLAVRLHVERLYEHHHDDDKTAYENSAS